MIDFDPIDGASHFWEITMSDVERRAARHLDMRMAASDVAELGEWTGP